MHDALVTVTGHRVNASTPRDLRSGEPHLAPVRSPRQAIPDVGPLLLGLTDDGAIAIEDGQPLGASAEYLLLHDGEQGSIGRNANHVHRILGFVHDRLPTGYSTHARRMFSS